MGYGSGGKYWNVGLSDTGRLGATKRQLSRLQYLTGIDHRGKGLTKEQASELIDRHISERKERRAGLSPMQDEMYRALVKSATVAANAAGERWLREHGEPMFFVSAAEGGERMAVHGRIGAAHITWPPKGQFHRWLVENMDGTNRKYIPIPHHYSDRMELDLQIACERAAYDVLRKAGNVDGIKVVALVEQGSSAPA